MRRATPLIVNAARSVARFATDVLRIIAGRFQPGVRRRFEIAHFVGMTFLTTLRAGKLRAGNLRRHHNCPRQRGAGNDYAPGSHNEKSQRDPPLPNAPREIWIAAG